MMVLLEWEMPPEGFAPDAFVDEDRRDLDDAALSHCSWRPLTALRDPKWTKAMWISLPRWRQRHLTIAEAQAQ